MVIRANHKFSLRYAVVKQSPVSCKCLHQPRLASDETGTIVLWVIAMAIWVAWAHNKDMHRV